jgi:Phage Tail Protein X
MINSDSRYRDSATVLISSPRGTNLAIVPGVARDWEFSYTYFLFGGQDRIDQIAQDVYGDATLWWHIADANPAILDWTSIPLGTVLRIPSV